MGGRGGGWDLMGVLWGERAPIGSYGVGWSYGVLWGGGEILWFPIGSLGGGGGIVWNPIGFYRVLWVSMESGGAMGSYRDWGLLRAVGASSIGSLWGRGVPMGSGVSLWSRAIPMG